MDRTAGSRADQCFIVEFDLADLSSHFFNQVFGFRAAAHKMGLVPHVLLSNTVNSALVDALGGRAVIDFPYAFEAVSEVIPDGFAEADLRLRSLWDELEKLDVSSSDMVIITSGRPLVIYSLGAWLGRLAPRKRPSVFIRVFDHRYVNLSTMEQSERSWIYRFVARDLALRPGQDRVFLTLNNVQLATTLGRICCRRVFEMPLPKYYGDQSEVVPSDEDGCIIYVHLNIRAALFMPHVFSVLRQILDTHHNVTFMLKYCLNAIISGEDAVLPADLVERGVELIAAEQSHDDHLRTIERSDVLLLPYEASEYKVLASGVFSEGAAFGKVIVCPNATWMSDQIADGYAAGVVFEHPTSSEVLNALSLTLENIDKLRPLAREKSASFRKHHSCEHNLELMRGLASSTVDMRPTYTVGTSVDFRNSSLSRCYLDGGWSVTEAAGVWSDGSESKLLLRWEQPPSGEVWVHLNLTPFVVAKDEQHIEVSADGNVLCHWSFTADSSSSVWRSFRIPDDIAVSDEIVVLLRFSNAKSPVQAGLSHDIRKLGAMLHAMYVGAELRPNAMQDVPALVRPRWYRAFLRIRRLVRGWV